ncbi:hypothetical protein LZ30DRAFT_198966 [Colletotrichum cereale]|nr:hypothetical protein LZ30DRAFT_198966 [Colletotrichum cereale]
MHLAGRPRRCRGARRHREVAAGRQLRPRGPAGLAGHVRLLGARGHQGAVRRGLSRHREQAALPRRSDPNVDVVRLVYDWLCAEENGQWLMVVDNADDVKVFYPKPESVQSGSTTSKTHQPLAAFLPQSSNGRILVTSRSRDVAERLTGSSRNVLSIEAMDEDQAHQLLQKKLQDAHDDEVAAELLRALEYMPLAITQAAAFILRRAPRMSPSTYLADFHKSEKNKASLLNRNMGDLRRDPSASNSIVTTWQITFDSIRQERQSAADLLAFLSFFNPQGIPEWVLRSYQRSEGDEDATESLTDDGTQSSQSDWKVDENSSSEDESEFDELEDDLGMLREFSLVTITTQKGMLEMHPLVRFCTQIWLSTTGNVRKWRRTFLQVLSREYPHGEFENPARCQELDPHTQSLMSEKPESKDELIDFPRLLYRVGWYKCKTGKYEEAEQLTRQAIEGLGKFLGNEEHAAIIGANLLGVVLMHQGKYREAEKIYRRAVEGFEKVLGKDHPTTLFSVNGLAGSLQGLGRYKEAEPMARQTLESREKFLGKEHHDTITSSSDLAIVLLNQGRHQEAEQMFRQTLESREKALGKDHPITLTEVSNLAASLRSLGRYKEAEQMNQRALESREKVLGKEQHPDTLTSISNLAVVLLDQKRYKEAEQMNQRALESRERVLGKEHPSTLTSVSILAHIYEEQFRIEEAYKLHHIALSGFTKVYGPNHPTPMATKQSISSLKECFSPRKRYRSRTKGVRR